MRCHICDAVLGENEVSYSRQHKEINPCPTCLQIIAEVFNEGQDEEEIDYILERDEDKLYDIDEEELKLLT